MLEGTQINTEAQAALDELLTVMEAKENQVIVVGCSTSEVAGAHIGKAGSPDLAEHIYQAIMDVANKRGVYIAFQCCEHLNRALVVDRKAMERYGWEEVEVIPHPKAGGSLASAAYRKMDDAVVVEAIKAHGGLDIGETLIGMHLKAVAVPVRLTQKSIGHARVNAAKTRPKLIGGERAKYSL